MSTNGPASYGAALIEGNPLAHCARRAHEFEAFNPENPLYGGMPVKALVNSNGHRIRNKRVVTRSSANPPSRDSFYKLRDGLYVTSPELTYVRMGNYATDLQLAEIAINLCGSYYKDLKADDLPKRTRSLTTPERLRAYTQAAESVRGRAKAERALRHVIPGSRSPQETKLFLVLTVPTTEGGYGLPFDAMNLNVYPGRKHAVAEQDEYWLDIAALKFKVATEYDGGDSHTNTSHDKRRRNALAALGWKVFPVEKDVLYSAEATDALALQLATCMGIRIRKPKNWNERNRQLRYELVLGARPIRDESIQIAK